MLNYKEFRTKVIDEFTDFLPIRFAGYKVTVNEISKVNKRKEGISLLKPDGGKLHFCPVIYIDDIYEQYECGKNFRSVMTEAGRHFSEAFDFSDSINIDGLIENIEKKVVCQVINSEFNKKVLMTCPSKKIMDLSVILRVIVNKDRSGVSSFILTNDIIEKTDIDTDRLFEKALENTKKLFPFELYPLVDIIRDRLRESDYPDDDPLINRIYVISDPYKFLGSSALLYPEIFERLSEELDSDLYIMPSSIRDLIVLPSDDFYDKRALNEMVIRVNREDVSAEDKLSDSLYSYNRKKKKIYLASVKEDII